MGVLLIALGLAAVYFARKGSQTAATVSRPGTIDTGSSGADILREGMYGSVDKTNWYSVQSQYIPAGTLLGYGGAGKPNYADGMGGITVDGQPKIIPIGLTFDLILSNVITVWQRKNDGTYWSIGVAPSGLKSPRRDTRTVAEAFAPVAASSPLTTAPPPPADTTPSIPTLSPYALDFGARQPAPTSPSTNNPTPGSTQTWTVVATKPTSELTWQDKMNLGGF